MSAKAVKKPENISFENAVEKLESIVEEMESDELPENVTVEKFFRVRSFVDGRWRMTLWVAADFGEMYDRKNDPHELDNLWNNTQHKEAKSRLLELMLKEQYRYSELMPRPIYMG